MLVTVVVDIAVADAVEAEAEAQKAKVTVRGAETARCLMKRHEPSFIFIFHHLYCVIFGFEYGLAPLRRTLRHMHQ